MANVATQCMLARDWGGYPVQTSNIALPFSTLSQSIPLTANVLSTITVPANPATRLLALFRYTAGSDVWVQGDNYSVLAIPVALEVSTKELNPESRIVTVNQTIQLITADTGVIVNITYYQLQANSNTGVF